MIGICKCFMCGKWIKKPKSVDCWYPPLCKTCSRKYPRTLLKATADEFCYAVGLSNGAVIVFHSMMIQGDWAILTGVSETTILKGGHIVPIFDRGIDVRLSDIIWVADAPYGS